MLAPILKLELTIFMTCELFNRMRRLPIRDPTVEIVGSATFLKNSFKQVSETFYIRTTCEGPSQFRQSSSPFLDARIANYVCMLVVRIKNAGGIKLCMGKGVLFCLFSVTCTKLGIVNTLKSTKPVSLIFSRGSGGISCHHPFP